MDIIIPKIMCLINKIKLYHWSTKSYARHKATCKYLELIDEKFDRLIETTMGCKNSRFTDNFGLQIIQENDKTIIDCINNFKKFLTKDFVKLVSKTDTDLLNIRDEILSDTNRLLYLFTLS